jgi:hypothetical protein
MAKHPHLKPPSPTNVDARPTEDWMTKDRPIKCVVLGRIGEVIGYEDYYFENEQVLCMQAFSTSTVATTIEHHTGRRHRSQLQDAEGPLQGIMCHHVLGLPPDSWASHRTESAISLLP